MIKNVLAIQNCGPSGTTLIQSLLDGHPKILSLPALHAQELLIFWETVSHLSREEIQSRFMARFDHFFSPETLNNGLGLKELGLNRDEVAIIDKSEFSAHLDKMWLNLDRITRKEYLDAVYIAYNKTLGRDTDQAEYILYPIHCLPIQYAKALVEDYDKVRFLHSVREPVQSIGSLAKHIDKNPGWDPLYLLTCVSAQLICDYAIHVGHRDAYGMRSYFPDTLDGRIESRAIKLEDLHRSPKDVLTMICQWLGVEWSDSLLVSTFNGKLWHNRPESIRQSGVGEKTISQRHSDIISNFDRYRFNILAKHFREKYGYKMEGDDSRNANKISNPLIFLLPFKLEYQPSRMARQYQFAKEKLLNELRVPLLASLFAIPYYAVTLITNYIKCRINWLFPAWKRIKSDQSFDFVELLK